MCGNAGCMMPTPLSPPAPQDFARALIRISFIGTENSRISFEASPKFCLEFSMNTVRGQRVRGTSPLPRAPMNLINQTERSMANRGAPGRLMAVRRLGGPSYGMVARWFRLGNRHTLWVFPLNAIIAARNKTGPLWRYKKNGK